MTKKKFNYLFIYLLYYWRIYNITNGHVARMKHVYVIKYISLRVNNDEKDARRRRYYNNNNNINIYFHRNKIQRIYFFVKLSQRRD